MEQKHSIPQKSAEPSDVEEEETRPEAPIPTTSETLQHLRKFHGYIEGQTDISEAVFNSLNVLLDFSNLKRIGSAKQSDILKYFQKKLAYVCKYCTVPYLQFQLMN